MSLFDTITPYFNGTTLVIIILLVSLYLYLRGPSGLPPAPPALPLIGNLWRILSMTYPAEEMMALSDKYGPVMRLKLGPRTAVILSTHKVIREAFVAQSQSTSGRPVLTRMTGAAANTGVIMKDGEKWKLLRRFSLSTLRDFGYGRNLIQEKIFDEFTHIQEVLESCEDGSFSDWRGLLTKATSNVICALVFGHRFDYDDPKFQDVLHALDEVLRRFNFMDTTMFLNKFPIFASQKKAVAEAVQFSQTIRDCIQSEIDEHKKDFDAANIRDYVDVYLQTQASQEDVGFVETDIFSTITDLFIAGTETTATTLSWAILYMMAFPEIQVRCQQELDKLIDGNRLVRLQDKAQLPYIEAVLMETQRHASILPLGVPHRVTQPTTIAGYHIPKDTFLMSNLYAAHHDKHTIEAPQVFRPERFLDKDGKICNADVVIPFSLGPRICLGEGLARSELFIFFANLMNHFTFTKQSPILDITSRPKTATIREPLGYTATVTVRHSVN